jgi:hypothetical protein
MASAVARIAATVIAMTTSSREKPSALRRGDQRILQLARWRRIGRASCTRPRRRRGGPRRIRPARRVTSSAKRRPVAIARPLSSRTWRPPGAARA